MKWYRFSHALAGALALAVFSALFIGAPSSAATPADCISPAASHHVIEFGDQGPEVFRLQEMLRLTGHLPGPADGIFGTDTAQALRQFQKSSNISIDAIAGPSTWAALSKSTGQLSSDKSPD